MILIGKAYTHCRFISLFYVMFLKLCTKLLTITLMLRSKVVDVIFGCLIKQCITIIMLYIRLPLPIYILLTMQLSQIMIFKVIFYCCFWMIIIATRTN